MFIYFKNVWNEISRVFAIKLEKKICWVTKKFNYLSWKIWGRTILVTFQSQVDKKVVGHVASVAQTRLRVSDTLTFPLPLIARCLATLGLRHRAIGSATQDLLPTSCIFSRYSFSRPEIKYFFLLLFLSTEEENFS